jgi:hypothetical protein
LSGAKAPHGRLKPGAAGAALRNLLLVSVPTVAILVVLLELFFRFVIPASEVPARFFDPGERLVRFDTSGRRSGLFTRGRFAELRARWRINDEGWNSDIEYEEASGGAAARRLIAIIGDSYVNSFQVDPEENLAAVLRRLLGGSYEVYRFGMPGAPLSHYLHMSRYVVRHFDPQVLVFVLVHNDFHQSLRELDPMPSYLQLDGSSGDFVEVPPTPPATSGPPVWMHSAIMRYLTITLQSYVLAGGVPPWRENGFVANVAVRDLERNRGLIERATRFLLERIRAENRDRTVVFVMDAPRLDLYRGELQASAVIWMNRMVERECRAIGIPFVDLTDRFSRVFREQGVRFESAVDAHWNEVGHREAARAIADKLVELGIVDAMPRAGGIEQQMGLLGKNAGSP